MMTYILVDDEPLALRDLHEVLKRVKPKCELACFTTVRGAIDYAKEHEIHVAFLDIEMGSVNGITLAKVLKELWPEMSVIFVTSHVQYAVEAFQIHATGYLLKPVDENDLRRELTFLYPEQLEEKKRKISVKTFGGFDVFVNGETLTFRRAKSKELLALLVDKRGNSITAREGCAVLWEDKPYGAAQKSYYQTIVAELRQALKMAGIENLLIKKRNCLSVRAELLECDSYRFMEGDARAINEYRHDYISCYSWAEFRMGEMEKGLD